LEQSHEPTNNIETAIAQAKTHRYHWEKELDFHADGTDEFDLTLPHTIQGSVRALRFSLNNPEYYWRIAERSYLRNTINSTVRKEESLAQFQKLLRKQCADLHKSKGDLREMNTLMEKLDLKLDHLERRVEEIVQDTTMERHLPTSTTRIQEAQNLLQDLQSVLMVAAGNKDERKGSVSAI
jgi:hypothetical protein